MKIIAKIPALLGALLVPTALYAAPQYSSQIQRTSFGVPHILAENERGVGYGLGYAYAQDNACVFLDEMVTVEGRRSLHFGADTVGGPDAASLSMRVPNRQIDAFMALLNDPAEVEQTWARQPESARELVRGYVAGFNRYLREAGSSGLPAACRGKPWVRPISTTDIMRLMRRYAVQGSSAQFVDNIVAAKPPTTGEKSASAAVSPELFSRGPDMQFGIGSNAIAFGKDTVQDGKGLLFANPHYPWEGILRFYQFHLTIPGRMDVMGVSLPGIPTVSIGFSRDFAWTHTVNTSVHMTLYRLELKPGDPTRYRFDGSWRKLKRKRVHVSLRTEDGGIRQEAHDLWLSDFGPVISRPGGLEWTARHAYALRDANWDNSRMIETWHGINLARTLDQVERVVVDNVGLPWVNLLAADREGRALYTDVTVTPGISKQKLDQCLVKDFEASMEHGIVVLDGANSDCLWDNDPAAPQPEIVAGRNLPVLWRSDFVQNANDSAWMTNPAAPLEGYSPTASADGVEQGGRTRMGIGIVRKRLSGIDGLPGNTFTADAMRHLAFTNDVFAAGLLQADLSAFCKSRPAAVTVAADTIDLAEACDTLRRWDGRASPESIGYPLFSSWWKCAEKKDVYRVAFDPRRPLETPAGLKWQDEAVAGRIRQCLGDAIAELAKLEIDWRKPWGEIQYVDVGTRHVPVPGGAIGDVYNSMYSLPEKGRMRPALGSSYIQIVGFDDNGPVADGLLAYSQSTNPKSPHAHDQLSLFLAGRLVRQPFRQEDIRNDPTYSVVTISE